MDNLLKIYKELKLNKLFKKEPFNKADFNHRMYGPVKIFIEELYLTKHLRNATREDYLPWLKGYLEKGGSVTHFYNHPFLGWDWYVAEKNINIAANFVGSIQPQIIIPRGISITNRDWGACKLFFIENYETTSWVIPSFEDTPFD